MLAVFFFVFAGWDLGEGDFAGGQLPRPPNFFGACGGLKEESIFSERAFGALGWDLGGRHFTGEGGRKNPACWIGSSFTAWIAISRHPGGSTDQLGSR